MVRIVMSETIPSTPDRETTSESVDPAREMGSRAVHVVCPRCQRESSQTLNPTASPQDARQESVADMSYAVVSEPTDVGDDEETETSPPVVLKDVDRDQLSKDIVFVRKELAKASELPPMYRLWRKAIEESDATFVDDPPIVPWFVDENGIPC